MQQKTRAIVFKTIKYRESSVISTLFTEKLGLQTYIVNNVRSRKSKTGMAFFQPLTLLNLVVYHKENSSLQRIAEMRCEDPYISIPSSIKKSSILLFLSEVLNKALKHESHPEPVFGFMYSSLLSLEHLEVQFDNFHLQFLLKLMRFLGFQPDSGTALRQQLLHGNSQLEAAIDHFLKEPYNHYLAISNDERRLIIDHILDFMSLHLDGFGKIKSNLILHDLNQ